MLLRCLLRRPVLETLPLWRKLLPASRSETDLCSNCLVLSSARSVLRTSIADNNTSIGCIDYSRCAVQRGTNSISPMTAAAALLSSFVRAVLTWRHRTVTTTRQAGRRHFFGGIATNCLNNSKSAPLSPSSSPLRTASSSPLVALFNLAFGKRVVLL